MDAIPFVKVSVEEAREALQKEAVKAETRFPQKREWAPTRARMEESPQEMVPATFKWLARLPASVRPGQLPLLYPRIANRIAELWKQPLECGRYLDELMLDQRGDRDGFPPAVAAEIAALKVHFFSAGRTLRGDVWDTAV